MNKNILSYNLIKFSIKTCRLKQSIQKQNLFEFKKIKKKNSINSTRKLSISIKEGIFLVSINFYEITESLSLKFDLKKYYINIFI